MLEYVVTHFWTRLLAGASLYLVLLLTASRFLKRSRAADNLKDRNRFTALAIAVPVVFFVVTVGGLIAYAVVGSGLK